MRIFKWKSLVGLVLVGMCSGSAVRALADDGAKSKPSDRPAGVKIDAASSGLNQTASANVDSNGSGAAPSEKGAGSPEAAAVKRESSGGERIVSESEQSLTASEATSQEPKRRALPAPLDGIFPGADYLGPTPLIGIPDTDPVYPLTKALWSVVPARIKVYGWISRGINVSTSNKSNIPESYAIVPRVELDQGVIRIERLLDTVQTDHVDWGFRLTPIYGIDDRWTTAPGWCRTCPPDLLRMGSACRPAVGGFDSSASALRGL